MPTSFIENRFPENVSYGSAGGPKFKTDVFTAASGFEQRNSIWADARAEYNVAHGIKDKTDMDAILAFFYNVRGKATGFRFKDWSDYTLTGQQIGVGDGTTTAFQIIKTYVTGASVYERQLKKIVANTISGVTVNGVAQTSPANYSVNINTGIITFVVPPANGHVIVVGALEFDVPVRFDTDHMPISIEAFEVESWSSIPLVEVRV
jgi:uncharacterized protein (TIGR02217 family)